MAAGRLPTLRALLDQGARLPVQNPPGTYAGASWPTFTTARSAARHGHHCWAEVTPGSYAVHDIDVGAIRGVPFWETLGRAGRRVAVLDVPRAPAVRDLRGIQLSEWGTHDRCLGMHTWPPALRDEVEARFGTHPISGGAPIDGRQFSPSDILHRAGSTRTDAELEQLLSGELDGLERKIALSLHFLAQGGWDLFVSVFGEPHSVGHQFWHLHDRSHPAWDPVLAERLGDAVEHVYRRLDAALAAHLAHTRPDDLVLVLMSHGMGPLYTGNHLLDRLLARLEAHDDIGAWGGSAARVLKLAWGSLPPATRRRLHGPAARAVRARLGGNAAPTPEPPPRPMAERPWFQVPSGNTVAAVRLNLVGREPAGLVPADRFAAVCDRLARDLGDVFDVATGRPVVAEVICTADHYARSRDDTLPDLVFTWSRHAPIDLVCSARTGVVAGRMTHWRTGDHLPDGLLVARGPRVPAGATLPAIAVEDVGPTVAARLGVTLPDVDGRPAATLL